MKGNYGRLSFLRDSTRKSNDGHKMSWWRCSCGTEKEYQTRYVTKGTTKSCGCLIRDIKPGLTHGMRGTPTYGTWKSMKARCESPSNKDYHRYGAVGIRVCSRWMTFENFLEDMGIRPKGTSLDRIDGTKGYEPGNCRWATPKEQARNNKRFTLVSTPKGTMPLIDYAESIGISNQLAHLRIKRGKLVGCKKICA
jgi:hypothetical protein